MITSEQRTAAEALLNTWTEQFVARFSGVVPPEENIGRSVMGNGQEFIEATNTLGPCLSLTPEHAVGEFSRVVDAALGKQQTGVLHWRIRPEIDAHEYKLRLDWLPGIGGGDDGTLRCWKVYARFGIELAIDSTNK